MADRCTGHCCKSFYLPYTVEGLRELAARKAAEGVWETAVEARQVADMIVPVEGEENRYSCIHHSADTGDCGIYLTRPRMCRDFPDDRPCPFVGCEWDAAKAGLHPSKRHRRLPMYVEGLSRVIEQIETASEARPSTGPAEVTPP